MCSVRQKEIESVLRQSGPVRYDHFVKLVVDQEQAWGLYKDGWVTVETDEGLPAFPLWPRAEYAEICAEGDWLGSEPKAIPLDELLEDLIPNLADDKFLPAIFMTPSKLGVTPELSALEEDLRREMERY